MNYISWQFIVFISATLLLFYFVGFLNSKTKLKIKQWWVLLIASLIFYGFTNYFYLIYLLGSSLVIYIASLFIQFKMVNTVDGKKSVKPIFVQNHEERRKYENLVCAISIVLVVGVLAVLKYTNFFINSFNSIFKSNLLTINFIIPLGISFYTFSLIAYIVDCTKRETTVEKNPLRFLLFVSYFPKILQGPISSYDKLKEDGLFSNHRLLDKNYLPCFFRIGVGLIKKIAVANILIFYVDGAYENLTNVFGMPLFLISLFYTIQLYCDFSGFLDITIGISGLFGIDLEENFNIPYISASIQEFWRRWHITLGAWLKKYIYIPLGGNRVPIWRWVINTLIVWLISGIWHGANWTFILWGLFHGILLVITGIPNQIRKKKGIVKEKKRNCWYHLFSIALTFLLVNLGWVLFRSDSVETAGQFYLHMFQVWKESSYNVFEALTIGENWWLIFIPISVVVLMIFVRLFASENAVIDTKLPKFKITNVALIFVVTIIMFASAIFLNYLLNGMSSGGSQFIYFDF